MLRVTFSMFYGRLSTYDGDGCVDAALATFAGQLLLSDVDVVCIHPFCLQPFNLLTVLAPFMIDVV
jgi:hypothetical protein